LRAGYLFPGNDMWCPRVLLAAPSRRFSPSLYLSSPLSQQQLTPGLSPAKNTQNPNCSFLVTPCTFESKNCGFSEFEFALALCWETALANHISTERSDRIRQAAPSSVTHTPSASCCQVKSDWTARSQEIHFRPPGWKVPP